MHKFHFLTPRSWLRLAFLVVLLILPDPPSLGGGGGGGGGRSSPTSIMVVTAALDVSSATPTAARKRVLKGSKPSGSRKPPGEGPDVVLGRRKDVGKAGRKGAPAASREEDVEEGLLEEAIRERSMNKYFAADPLWTGQLMASGLAWFLVLAAASMPMDVAGERPVLMVLAVRHALGLAADIRRVLREAVEGDVDRTKIRKLARGLTRVPGAPSYLLYTAALLTWPPSKSGKGTVKGLGPLLLREFFTALAAGLDVLQILGVSSEVPSGPAAAARCGPRRPMPSSLSTISLLLETSLGVSLLVALLRTGNEGGMFNRRCLATLLYANFLFNRAGHLPGLKEALGRRSVGKAVAALLKPLFSDLEPATRQLTAITRATLAQLDTLPGGGTVRSTLRLLGFLDEEEAADRSSEEEDKDSRRK